MTHLTDDGGTVEILTGRDLMRMTDDEMDARAHRKLLARQRAAFAAVTDGRCTPACVAAVDRWGDCSCACRGAHHADAWSTDLVPMGDWG